MARLLLFLALAGCGRAPALRPPSELVGDCFGYPARAFDPSNFAPVNVRLQAGSSAVDFSLADPGGKTVQLSQLLSMKPVLLVQGNLTCPRFQEQRAALEETVARHRDRLTTVIVYNLEAHPAGGEPSPYSGKPWLTEFSDRGQQKSADERIASARELAASTEAKVLVDAYDAPSANPIWCTYGTCPSCAWLMTTDGAIVEAHKWYDPEMMEAAIGKVLK